jgi:hypothetical protein
MKRKIVGALLLISGGGSEDQQQHKRANYSHGEHDNYLRQSVFLVLAKTGVFRKHARE